MGKNIYIICVVYNEKIDCIRSLEQFMRLCTHYSEVQLLMMDNSSDEGIRVANLEIAENNRMAYRYYSNDGNVGLAKSYSRAIEMIDDEDYWIMLADDDTFFSYEYLVNVYNEIQKGRSKIISGIIKCGERYLSPISKCKIILREKDFIKTPGNYSNIYCINSGLCINSSIVKSIPYDTRFFVDMIDYWFMEKLIEKRCSNIEIISGEIQQNFSGYNNNVNVKALESRYCIYKKDFVLFCKETKKGIIYKGVTLFKRWLHIKLLVIKSNLKSK